MSADQTIDADHSSAAVLKATAIFDVRELAIDKGDSGLRMRDRNEAKKDAVHEHVAIFGLDNVPVVKLTNPHVRARMRDVVQGGLQVHARILPTFQGTV